MQDTAANSPTVRPLCDRFGAEVIGVDLTQPLSLDAAKAIRDIWIDRGVLLFRGCIHNDEAQMWLSEVFGKMEPSATADMNDPDNRYIMTLSYDPNDPDSGFKQHYRVGGIERAGWLGWHWDQAFMPTIVRGATLRMVEPSPEMGETGFIDGIEAYQRLSPKMQQRIDKLAVVYEFNPAFDSGQFGFPGDIERLPLAERNKDYQPNYDFPPVVHPLVIQQVETGRKVLKLSPMHARYILGMNRAESDSLLAELAEHLVDQRFGYFHQWQHDDVLVWDNWRVIHMANGVPLHCRRVARRTTIMGDYECGRYLNPQLSRDREIKRIVD